LDIQALQEDMNLLKRGNIEIDEFLLSKESELGEFRRIMGQFVTTSKNLTAKLESLYNAGMDGYTKLIITFGENGATIQEFFGTLDKFCLSFVRSKFEIQDARANVKQKQALPMTISKTSKIDQVFQNLTSGQGFT